jgi:hypothetical protein
MNTRTHNAELQNMGFRIPAQSMGVRKSYPPSREVPFQLIQSRRMGVQIQHRCFVRSLILAGLLLVGVTAMLATEKGPSGLPAHVEDVIARRVQTLERALLRRDASLLQPWLAPDFRAGGCAGDNALPALEAALGQLRQAESLQMKAVRTLVPPYRVTVCLKSHGLASDREIVLSATFRFLEINLFQAEARTVGLDTRILVSWEPGAAPLPDRIEDRFEVADKLVAVEGITVNGQTGCLILDTGTTTLLLHSRRFAPWICQPPEAGVLTGAAGSSRNVVRIWVRDFNWKGYRLAGFETIATDLTSLEARIGRPVLGLIGARILRPFDLTLDYGRKKLVLHRLDAAGEHVSPQPVSAPEQTLPFDLAGPLPVLPVKVGNACLRLGVDSGATATVIDEAVVHRLDVSQRSVVTPGRVRGVGPDRRSCRRFRLEGAQLGRVALPRMQAVVIDLSHQRDDCGLAIDGLLGYEFLRRQPVTINYVKQEIRVRIPAADCRAE